MRTIFLDRDGVINENRCDHVTSWDEFVFLPRALTALRWLRQAGFRVFVVTNQAIISRGLATTATLDDIHSRMARAVAAAGGAIADLRYCPHDAQDRCGCRKPRPGMLLDLAAAYGVDLGETFLVGDALTDVAAARAAGCGAIMVRTGRGEEQLLTPQAALSRPDHVADDLLAAVRWVIAGSPLPALTRGAAD